VVVDLSPPCRSIPIAEMDFRVHFWITKQMDTRVRNGLQRAGVFTLGQLLDCTRDDLEDFGGLGVVSAEVIKCKLRSMGLKLKAGHE